MKKVILIIFLFSLLILSPAFVSASSNVESEILEKLTEKNEVTVIVKLNDIDLPYKDLPELRNKIKKNQDDALSILDDDFKILYRYEVLNAFAGSINSKGLEKLRDNPLVEMVYIDRILHTTLAESVPLINADDVWQIKDSSDLYVTGKGQTVCVIDSGVDYTHPDLGGCLGLNCKVLSGIDFINFDNDPMDDYGHGTHVAGIVAANGGIKGVAPDAKLVATKVCNATGSCPEVAMIAGMDWCINHKDAYNISVITMSLGNDGEYDHSNCPKGMNFSIDMAYNQGIPVTISSGNNGHSNGISYPACSPHAISVGATYDANVGSQTWCLNIPCTQTCIDSTTAADQVTCFTNSDEILDLMAPGSLITSTSRGGGPETRSGTSMAAPHVAGTIALMKQLKPYLSPDNIEYILKGTGVNVTDTKNGLTFPRIDALGAISPYCDAPTNGMIITKNTTFCPGNYSLPNGISIGASNIVLNCNGAELVGNGPEYGAIGIINRNNYNIVIKNCNVTNYRYGIYFYEYASSNRIENNVLTNIEYGIYISRSNYNTLIGNNITNGIYGIYVDYYYDSDYTSIIKNNIDSTNYGIYLPADHTNITQNTITQSIYEGITSAGSYNEITHNIINQSSHGIQLSGSYNKIAQNIIKDSTNYGIYLVSSTYSNITQNTIKNSTNNGIYVYQSSGYNNIWDNDIYDKGIWYESTNWNKYCIDGIGNRYYNGTEGPTCSCIPLLNNLIVSSNETFCVRSYSLPLGISIGANSIVLDCNGIELIGTGPGNYGYGITINNYNNVMIKKCNLKNYQYGIGLYGSYNDITLNNLTANGYGIYSSGASYNKIENNVLSDNSYGIYASNSDYNTLIENTITNNSYGIYLYWPTSSDYNNVKQNNLTNNYYGIYLGYGSYNNITQNTIKNSTYYGIYVDPSSGHNNIWDNDIYDKGIFYISTNWNKYCIDGIGNRYLDGFDGPTCSCIPLLNGLIVSSTETFCVRSYSSPNGISVGASNIVLDCNGIQLVGSSYGTGITIGGYSNVVIKNCIIKGYQQYGGIYMSGTSNNKIENNVLLNNSYGIYAYSSNYNTLMANVITKNYYGIYSYYSNYNKIRHNIISNNNNGIYLEYYNFDNNITYNDLLENNYNLYNNQNNNVNAENNWWGTINTVDINASIYDFYDDLSYGIVGYQPFLYEPEVYLFPDWLFNLSISLNSTNKGNRYLGLYRNATDYYDENIDDLAPPPEMSGFDVYFANNQASPLDRFSKDIKTYLPYENWILVITAPKKNQTVVSWSPNKIPYNLNLTMFEIDQNGQPIGNSIDMKNQTFITVQGGNISSNTKRYKILGIRTFTEGFRFKTGWNFISTPFDVSYFTTDKIFGNQILGSVWTWDGQKYVNVSHLEPKKAYWIAVDHDFSLNITGNPVYDLDIPISSGWNMMGPIKPMQLPLPSPVTGSIWTWDGTKYIVEGNILIPKIGYWVAATANSTIPFSMTAAGHKYSTEGEDSYSIVMSLTLDGTDKGNRIFGIAQGATDLFDKGIDDLAPPHEMSEFDSYFSEEEPEPKDRLSIDIKALENNKNWVFVVVAPEHQTVIVSWNPLSIPDDLNVSMVRVDANGHPIGTPFDMKGRNSITVVGGEFTTTEIYGINMNISVIKPNIVILSPVNNTSYYKNYVPLNFTITNSTTISWIGYSLNNTKNVTITGSINLTKISDKWNNITVYANDTSGNMGASNTVILLLLFRRYH
jgi:parallel beta-helix repeat protein